MYIMNSIQVSSARRKFSCVNCFKSSDISVFPCLWFDVSVSIFLFGKPSVMSLFFSLTFFSAFLKVYENFIRIYENLCEFMNFMGFGNVDHFHSPLTIYKRKPKEFFTFTVVRWLIWLLTLHQKKNDVSPKNINTQKT